MYNNPNIADVLNEFPSVHVDPEFLLSQLPLIQPRYYSISSSPNMYPEEVHLTMSIVSYHIHGKFDNIIYLFIFELIENFSYKMEKDPNVMVYALNTLIVFQKQMLHAFSEVHLDSDCQKILMNQLL